MFKKSQHSTCTSGVCHALLPCTFFFFVFSNGFIVIIARWRDEGKKLKCERQGRDGTMGRIRRPSRCCKGEDIDTPHSTTDSCSADRGRAPPAPGDRRGCVRAAPAARHLATGPHKRTRRKLHSCCQLHRNLVCMKVDEDVERP